MTTHADSPRHVPVDVAGGCKSNQSSESSYAMQAQAGESHDNYGKLREAKLTAKDADWWKESEGAYLYSRISVKGRKSWSAEKPGEYYYRTHFFLLAHHHVTSILSRRINLEPASCCQNSVIGPQGVHAHINLDFAALHSTVT